MKTKLLKRTALLLCALIAGMSSVWAAEVTFTPGTDTGTTSVTKEGVTATMTTMDNSSYYQIYANQSGTFTVSSGNITKIEFTCTASETAKYGPGNASANVGTYSYSGFTGTWTGEATSVTISSTAQIRMSSLTITISSSDPTIEAVEESISSFTYVVGEGPSTSETLTVTGSNLSANISASVTTGDSFFEISADESTWSNTLAMDNEGDIIAVRMKSGLAKGNYEGAVTLSSTGASNVVVSLSGTVTDQTYNIVLTQPATGGTIAADVAKAESGATVTLTATPSAAYNFSSWQVEDEDENAITVTGTNPATFTMPAKDVLVSATFAAKPTYAITCVASPVSGGEIISDLDAAYEGQTVTLSYTAASGYGFSAPIVITKTSDGSATDITLTSSGSDYTFTMPDYAVTATATFISNTYEGSFVKYSGAIVEGDYLLVYNNGAMNNTVSSSRFGITTVAPASDIISNPSREIVWHISPSNTAGYWTIYNAKVGKYAANTNANSTNVNLASTEADQTLWEVSGAATYEFRNKTNKDGNYTSRTLRRNGTSGFASYQSSTGGALTLYKYTILTAPTLTFNDGTVRVGQDMDLSTLFSSESEGVVTYSITAGSDYATIDGNILTGVAEGDVTVQASVAPAGTYSSATATAVITVTAAKTLSSIAITTPPSKTVYSEGDVFDPTGMVVTATYTDASTEDVSALCDYDTTPLATSDTEVEISYTENEITKTTTQAVSVVDYVVLPFIWNGGTSAEFGALVGATTIGTGDYAETNAPYRIKMDSANDYIQIHVNAQPVKVYVDVKKLGGDNTSTIKIQESETGESFTDVEELEISGSQSTVLHLGTTAPFAASTRYVRIIKTTHPTTGGNIGVGAVSITDKESVTVGSTGYTTYVPSSKVGFPEGVTAYIATATNSSSVTLAAKTSVPASTPIIIEAAAGTYTLPIIDTDPESVTGNLLRASNGTVTGDASTIYALGVGKSAENADKVGFYLVQSGVKIPACKAYLNTAAGVKEFLNFDYSRQTGVQSMDNGQSVMDNGSVYNLAGQRVNRVQKGIFIINGKKVVK